MTHSSTVARLAKGMLLLVLVCANPAAARGAEFTRSERQALLASGFASASLLDEIETAGWARVLVSYAVEGVAPRLPERAYTEPGAQAALAAASAEVLEILGTDGFRVRHRYRAMNALAGEISARGLVRLFAQRERVAVELDRGGKGQLAQAIPLVNLDAIQALAFTGDGITLAVLDTGIDTGHPDLMDDLVAERCFCSDNGNGCCPDGSSDQSGAGSAEDDNGHGTNVTGIVTSAGTISPLGGAPDAEIVAVKVLDSNNEFCCTADLLAGLDYVLNERPDVDLVNLSLATDLTYSGDCDNTGIANMLLKGPIESLRSNGVLTIAASGDTGSGTEMPSPACLSSVLAVGAVYDSNVGSVSAFGCTDATTAADQVACWSSGNASTDLLAPGARTTSTGSSGPTSTFLGTSQASPLVAACAAALLEARPIAAPAELETALTTSPTQLSDPKNGLAYPRLDCIAAVAALRARAVPVSAPPGLFLVAALLLGTALLALRRSRQQPWLIR